MTVVMTGHGYLFVPGHDRPQGRYLGMFFQQCPVMNRHDWAWQGMAGHPCVAPSRNTSPAARGADFFICFPLGPEIQKPRHRSAVLPKVDRAPSFSPSYITVDIRAGRGLYCGGRGRYRRSCGRRLHRRWRDVNGSRDPRLCDNNYLSFRTNIM